MSTHLRSSGVHIVEYLGTGSPVNATTKVRYLDSDVLPCLVYSNSYTWQGAQTLLL